MHGDPARCLDTVFAVTITPIVAPKRHTELLTAAGFAFDVDLEQVPNRQSKPETRATARVGSEAGSSAALLLSQPLLTSCWPDGASSHAAAAKSAAAPPCNKTAERGKHDVEHGTCQDTAVTGCLHWECSLLCSNLEVAPPVEGIVATISPAHHPMTTGIC